MGTRDIQRRATSQDAVIGEDSQSVTGGSSATRSTDTLVETASFDGVGRLVFRVDPVGPPIGTVVLASSLFAEFQRNYRREVLLARAAAAAGFTSLRFHYRGVGNSLGEPIAPDLETMAADITDVLASAASGPQILIGTRLGALAASKVRQQVDVPTVLWEPVLDGARWVEEVIRARLAREVTGGEPVSAASVREGWETDGKVYVLGETVGAEIVKQVGDTGLLDVIAGSAPVLIVQMGRSDRVRPPVDKTRDALIERGIQADVLPIVGQQVWWVNEGGDLFRPLERDDSTAALNSGVLEWAKRVVA